MSETPSGTTAPPVAPRTGVRVRIFGRTDVGMIREHNEDNFLVADLSQRTRTLQPEVRTHVVGERGTLFAVCDGMGGAAAGEVASQMAVDTIYDLMQNTPVPTDRAQFAQRMVHAINEAGARIFLAAKANRAQRGMGTTATVAGVFGRTLFVGQVGDSRAYLVRKGRIKQITKDQSLVSKLIEAGQLTEAEAETYEHSHVILQALGTSDTVSVDLSYIDLCEGDTVLLCSDGLSGLVTAEQMREVLATIDDPMEACKRLTGLANEAGGHDNVTVIVARFDGDLPPPGPADEQFGYQPYVIAAPMDQAPAVRASGRIKGADAPPPGKDVKYAVSMRPPPMSTLPSAMQPATIAGGGAVGDDEELRLPVSSAPRTALAVFLIALAVGVLGTAAFMLLRGRGGAPAPPAPSEGHTVVLSTDAAPVTTAIAPPSGWTAGDGDAGSMAGADAAAPTAAPASATDAAPARD
jgi:protein phosphatase